jgi:hypothetical protein
MSVDNKPIIISAPIGGLGRHLAALVDYAVNSQAESLDLTRPVSPSIGVTTDEFVSPTVQPLSPLQFWHWDYDTQGRIPVLYSTQSPEDIVKDYPDARIIQVVTTSNDSTQLAYNYLVIEQWRSVRAISSIKFIREVRILLGQDPVVSFDEIFADTQFMDDIYVQVLIQRFANSNLILPKHASPRADLVLNFSDICCPANTAGNADIQPLLDFVQDIRPAGEVSNLWYTFIRSLHHAKRNILNTANWS